MSAVGVASVGGIFSCKQRWNGDEMGDLSREQHTAPVVNQRYKTQTGFITF